MEQRVLQAQNRPEEAERLIEDYLPFIKTTILPYARQMEFDDLLSLGMLAFVGAIRRYKPQRGGFIAFAKLCIRSRILDDLRRNAKAKTPNTLVFPAEDEGESPADVALALQQYGRDAERQLLAEEIAALRQELDGYGICFTRLAKTGPKQKRAQLFCRKAAYTLLSNPTLTSAFASSKRLPQAELASLLKVSPKTLEKHRQYIVTLAVLLQGDYPAMRSFIPNSKEAD